MSTSRPPPSIAVLTSGGLAPCLSYAIASLYRAYQKRGGCKLILYKHGYRGLLVGDSIAFATGEDFNVEAFEALGGSPIGTSRVKLTNVEDCEKRGFIKANGDPLKVAAEQLKKDGVDILHVIVSERADRRVEKRRDACVERRYIKTTVAEQESVSSACVSLNFAQFSFSSSPLPLAFNLYLTRTLSLSLL